MIFQIKKKQIQTDFESHIETSGTPQSWLALTQEFHTDAQEKTPTFYLQRNELLHSSPANPSRQFIARIIHKYKIHHSHSWDTSETTKIVATDSLP